MSLVKLNINNRDFEIECGLGQEDALVNLSYELDRRMKENAKTFGDTNTYLLLIITALQLLDEVSDLRNGSAQGINVSDEVGKETIATLSQISGRIEQMAQIISRKAS